MTKPRETVPREKLFDDFVNTPSAAMRGAILNALEVAAELCEVVADRGAGHAEGADACEASIRELLDELRASIT